MKEMEYGLRKKCKILYSGEYKGHKFAIINLWSHPTAYVENKMGITDYYDCRLDNVDVHGGFTYCDTGYWNEESNKISWLGWDYAHYGDFIYGNTLSGRRWSTAEIYEEVKSVINQIIAVEPDQTIIDLITEFDEMGFAPTTLHPDPEQYAIDWRDQVRKEFARLIAERDDYKSRAEAAEQEASSWKDCANKWQKYYKEEVALEDKIESGEIVNRNDYLDHLISTPISELTRKENEFFLKLYARMRRIKGEE